jgi:hypothetical protein
MDLRASYDSEPDCGCGGLWIALGESVSIKGPGFSENNGF